MKEKNKRVRAKMLTVMLMVSLGMGYCSIWGNADIAKAASKKPKLNKTKIELTKGETFKLKLSNSKNVKWSSNKKSVATINKKGKVTAKKNGNAVISAKYLKKIYKCKVKVVKSEKIEENNKLTLSLSQTSAIISVADQIALSVSVVPSSEANRVIWSTSDEKVATVQNGIVTGVSAGTCVIAASIDNIVANCTIQVNQAYGSVSGNITYYFNKYKGNVPDTDSNVILIPKDGTANAMPTLKSYVEWKMMDILDGNKYKIYSTKVDGTGQFSFSNIPIGEYIIFIISKGTTSASGFDDKSAYATSISGIVSNYVNSENAKYLGQSVGLQKYNSDSIVIRKDIDTKYSHDFGMTYY